MDRAEELFQRLQKEGETAINAFIRSRQSEELFLDFKRSSDNGAGTSLSQEDRNNLAKAISGFGNAEGGVVVWGVDCSRDPSGADVARAKQSIQNPTRFVSLLQSVVSGCTIPAHPQVEHAVLHTNPDGTGYIATLIPQSDFAPHQTVYSHQYYMRAGSSFVPVPHGVLAGMFGKRPQPKVFVMYTVGRARKVDPVGSLLLSIGFQIANDGKGIARDSYLNVEMWSSPGPSCEITFEITDRQHWIATFAFGVKLAVISTPDFRLAPHNIIQPIVLNARIQPPFNKNMKIVLKCGCDGAPAFDGELVSSPEQMSDAYAQMVGASDLNNSHDFVGRFFGIPSQEAR